MRVIYLTTSLDDPAFDSFYHDLSAKPNPSNQNLHYRLISSLLEAKVKVDVVSLVPISGGKEYPNIDDEGIYHYLNYPDNPLSRFPSRAYQLTKIGLSLPKEKDTIILYDSLNLKLAKAAFSLSKKLSCPVVAILTDNPFNFVKASSIYANKVFEYVKKATASIALNEGLLKAFSMKKKPHVLFEGIVDEPVIGHTTYKKGSYIYYAGSFYPKYGLNNLIKAYKNIHPDYDLVLSGHHADMDYLNSVLYGETRIYYLGQQSRKKNLLLEKDAALLVNPRPYDKKLDEESIPSKLLEYLASGTCILSTKQTALMNLFKNDVNWLNDDDEEGLESYLRKHLTSNGKLKNLKPNNAQKEILSLYGRKAIGKKVQLFLTSLISFSMPSTLRSKSK